MDLTIAWALAALLVLLGIAGLVLPLLPGTVFIFLGAALGAWIEDYTRISGSTVAVLAALTLLAWLCEYISGLLGAKAAGASRAALIGAACGTVLGVFSGLWGLLVFPVVGAVAGEFYARGEPLRAGSVGFATWFGLLLGTLAKVVIGFIMVGVLIGALLV